MHQSYVDGDIFITGEKKLTMVEEVVASVALVISTAILALVGIISLFYNRKIISQMQIERKDNSAAYLVCSVIPNYSISHPIFDIVMHNQGNGPAKNIQILLTLEGETELKFKFNLLGPNGKLILVTNYAGDDILKTNVRLDYDDIFGKSHHDESKIYVPGSF